MSEEMVTIELENYENMKEEIKDLKESNKTLIKEKLIYRDYTAFNNISVYGDDAKDKILQQLIAISKENEKLQDTINKFNSGSLVDVYKLPRWLQKAIKRNRKRNNR